MILYLKTTFDKQIRKFTARRFSFSKKNIEFVDTKEFKEYNDIENTGILSLKVTPFEIKTWYDNLSDDIKKKDYILFYDGGWISIPGKTIDMISFE